MNMTTETLADSADAIVEDVQAFLRARTKALVPVDQDLFASGLVSSIFAMELVVHLEQTYSVAIVGADLKLDNFRTIKDMTVLVQRLRDAGGTDRG
jgi:methoxymalonate biosynthesis acyl carrier protein